MCLFLWMEHTGWLAIFKRPTLRQCRASANHNRHFQSVKCKVNPSKQQGLNCRQQSKSTDYLYSLCHAAQIPENRQMARLIYQFRVSLLILKWLSNSTYYWHFSVAPSRDLGSRKHIDLFIIQIKAGQKVTVLLYASQSCWKRRDFQRLLKRSESAGFWQGQIKRLAPGIRLRL